MKSITSLSIVAGLLVSACSGPAKPTRGPRADLPESSPPEPSAQESGRGTDRSRGASDAPGGTVEAAQAVLDDWHDAVAKTDRSRYFAHFTDDAVFLGSDPGERWTVQEFERLYGPGMDQGRGWTCLPRDRFVNLGPNGQVAWVDELLDHASYGVWRGTGVLRFEGGAWKVAHYSMTFAVPNAVADEVVVLCRDAEE